MVRLASTMAAPDLSVRTPRMEVVPVCPKDATRTLKTTSAQPSTLLISLSLSSDLESGRIIVTGTVSVNKKLPIRGICFDCSPVFQFSRTLAEECPAETRGLRGFREVVLVLTVANNKGFLSHASVTTNSKPSLVGSKVINAGEPSSFLREATWLFQPTRAQCGNKISLRRRERRLRCSEAIL